jgi:sulfur-carrier protein
LPTVRPEIRRRPNLAILVDDIRPIARVGPAFRMHSRRGIARCGQQMAKVIFTPNIQRHVLCPDAEVSGRTVREVLDKVFAQNPQARTYVLDDQMGLRKHMTIFVDGQMIRDRGRLADAVDESSTVYVFQALSGG